MSRIIFFDTEVTVDQ